MRRKATPRSGNYNGVKVSRNDANSVTDWERGTFGAGVLLAISYVLMGVMGAWFGW